MRVRCASRREPINLHHVDCFLAEKERSVSELEAILSIRQSALSQQLARLRYDDLVTTRRDGKHIYYSIADEDVRRVISVVYDIFCQDEQKPRP